MIVLLYTIHVLICFFLIAVVLLQQGKGADLSVFGGGATQTAFGARGAATVLHKMTVISFVLFILTTLGIGVYQSKQSTSGVFEGLDEEAAATVPAASDEASEAAGDGGEEPAEEPEGAFAVDTDEAAAEDGDAEPAADDASGAADGGTDGGTEDAGTEDAGTEGGEDAESDT